MEAYTYRWNSHVGPEDDGANNYRTRDEMRFWKENCPIELLAEKAAGEGILKPGVREVMEREIAEEIGGHFKFAKESEFPEPGAWRAMNWNDASPLADRLLATESEGGFDQFQPDARLGPY